MCVVDFRFCDEFGFGFRSNVVLLFQSDAGWIGFFEIFEARSLMF